MNTSKIRHASSEIDRYTEALHWLEEHGSKITKEVGEKVTYRPNFSGSCRGANDAAVVLAEMMSNQLPSLIPKAIQNCKNTIEIYREQIREEANSQKGRQA